MVSSTRLKIEGADIKSALNLISISKWFLLTITPFKNTTVQHFSYQVWKEVIREQTAQRSVQKKTSEIILHFSNIKPAKTQTFTEHCSHTCSPGSTPGGEKCEVSRQVTSSTCFGLPRETSRRATRMGTFKIACTSNCLCLESQHVLSLLLGSMYFWSWLIQLNRS